jgi:hypothetical protein
MAVFLEEDVVERQTQIGHELRGHAHGDPVKLSAQKFKNGTDGELVELHGRNAGPAPALFKEN